MAGRSSPPARVTACLAAALSAIGALAIPGACEGPPVAQTPLPATGVMQEIALLGGSVDEATSGDPGCAEPGQAGLAIHLAVRIPAAAGAETEVYLFTYADRPAWTREADAFDRCFGQYASGPLAGGRPVARIDVSPYRAFGPAWTAGATDVLTRAMTAAAGNGG